MKNRKKGQAQLHGDVRSMRRAVRAAMIEAGRLYSFRPVTVPDARKVASKAACRGKVRLDD